MSSFPKMKDLPLVLDSTSWRWERYQAPSAPSHNFWIGLDPDGNKWLAKFKGSCVPSFYAYREIVFARLAQKMGWSCQSSVFLRLDKQSAETLGVDANEVRAAHWFMKEHSYEPCSAGCPYRSLLGRSIRTVDDLAGSSITHLLDWPKSQFAACLFGGGEPPDKLFTTAHEFVIIDSEQMFSSSPCTLEDTNWWNRPDGSPSLAGRALALEVCRDLCSLSEFDLDEALAIPKAILVQQEWPIAPLLKASYEFAAEFVASNT